MTAIDFAIPSIWYGATTRSNLYKFSGLTVVSSQFNAAFNNTPATLNNGINTSDRIPFYPQLVMNPSNPLWLYFGSHRIYQSYDGEGTWNLLSPEMTNLGIGSISAIAVSPAAVRTVAVGTNDGKVQVNTKPGPGRFND